MPLPPGQALSTSRSSNGAAHLARVVAAGDRDALAVPPDRIARCATIYGDDAEPGVVRRVAAGKAPVAATGPVVAAPIATSLEFVG